MGYQAWNVLYFSISFTVQACQCATLVFGVVRYQQEQKMSRQIVYKNIKYAPQYQLVNDPALKEKLMS